MRLETSVFGRNLYVPIGNAVSPGALCD
jgi:hypothetical protein